MTSIIDKLGSIFGDNLLYRQGNGDQESYDRFIEQFPVSSLRQMSLTDYCMGTGRQDNFSWWLERGLVQSLGKYHAGSARAHIIYQHRDGTYYKRRSLESLTDENAMAYVAKIHAAVASATPDDYLWLDDSNEIFRRANVEPRGVMGQGRLMRLLNMYHPEHMPLISSVPHLVHFLRLFGEENIPSSPMQSVALYLEHFEKIRERFDTNITPFGLTCALYSPELGVAPAARTVIQRESLASVDEEIDEPASNTFVAKNKILYGPPGTGKTYATRDYAVKLADPEWHRDLQEQDLEEDQEREKLFQKYAELETAHRIVFTTIHQSYSYEDFLEGIRASSVDGAISYDVEDGVLKKMADNASASIVGISNITAEIDLDGRRIWKMSLGNTQREDDDIYQECLERGYVAHGYGRSLNFSACDDLASITAIFNDNDTATLEKSNFPAKLVNIFKNKINISDLIIITDGNKKFRAIGEVVGDYEFLDDDPIERFQQGRKVNWLRVYEQSVPKEKLFRKSISQMTLYELRPNTLYLDNLAELLASTPDKAQTPQYVLILDEINRGNISRIFGELITLLEPDKRLGQTDERKVVLPYSKKPFALPSNLHLIGTMNTADKSLAQLDLALRRRFEFIEMMPEPELLDGVTVYGVELATMLSTINARIEVLLDRDHQIGHSYFWPVRMATDSESRRARLAQVFQLKIIPLLQEYFYADWERIRWVLNDTAKPVAQQFITQCNTPEIDMLFAPDIASQLNNRRYRINESAFFDAASYELIVGRTDKQ